MSIKKIVFEGTSWIRNNWYIASNIVGNSFVFDYDQYNNQMRVADAKILLYQNDIIYSSSPLKTAYDVTYHRTSAFRKIERCPAHPECEGKWLTYDAFARLDSISSGGGNSPL